MIQVFASSRISALVIQYAAGWIRAGGLYGKFPFMA